MLWLQYFSDASVVIGVTSKPPVMQCLAGGASLT